jgi:hypothetical protein
LERTQALPRHALMTVRPEPVEALYLRLQAARCRRLAAMTDDGAKDTLLELSDRYEAEADALSHS